MLLLSFQNHGAVVRGSSYTMHPRYMRRRVRRAPEGLPPDSAGQNLIEVFNGKKRLRDFPLEPDTETDDFTYVMNLRAFFDEVDGQKPRNERDAKGDVVRLPDSGSRVGWKVLWFFSLSKVLGIYQ